MNTSVFYVTSILISCTGIFLLWHLGIKPLLLDDFRDSLFLVRDRLYGLAQSGKVSCNSPSYRAVESFINSVIQYAHRYTFLTFLLSYQAVLAERRSGVESEYAKSLTESIELVDDPAVRSDLTTIVEDVTLLLPAYIGKSSFAFILSSLFYLTLKSFSPAVAEVKRNAVSSFESEAFRAAESEKFAPA